MFCQKQPCQISSSSSFANDMLSTSALQAGFWFPASILNFFFLFGRKHKNLTVIISHFHKRSFLGFLKLFLGCIQSQLKYISLINHVYIVQWIISLCSIWKAQLPANLTNCNIIYSNINYNINHISYSTLIMVSRRHDVEKLTVVFFHPLVETEESAVQQYVNPEWRHDY